VFGKKNSSQQLMKLGLFGTAHNNFISCCELFFLSNTYFQNSFMGEVVFLLLSQRHKLDEAGKKQLIAASPSFLSLNYA